jgi:transposase-like protein
MALCSICSNAKARQINLRLLTGARIKATAEEFGLSFQMVRHHRRYCLPWRHARTPKAQTIQEKLEELDYELRRLTVLGECGDKIGPAIQAVVARRGVLELQARMENLLGATHRKLFPPKMELEEDYEVIFENGSPRTVTASEARRIREQKAEREQ